MGFFLSASPFHMGSPHTETGTVFFAIHSVTQIWCITKKMAEKLIHFRWRRVVLKHIIVAKNLAMKPKPAHS